MQDTVGITLTYKNIIKLEYFFRTHHDFAMPMNDWNIIPNFVTNDIAYDKVASVKTDL
jgi:hypothetical protein